MLAGWPSLAGMDLGALTSAMVTACEEYSLDAVAAACERFAKGEVDRNHAFPPTAPELASQARMLHNILNRVTVGGDGLISYRMGEEPPPGATPLGPVKIEVAGRVRDVSHLTYEEKMAVLATGKMPDEQIEGRVVPRLRSMGEA